MTTSSSPTPPFLSSREQLPWMEKYRPKRLKHVVHQQQVINLLRAYLKAPQLPHLLFYGAAGTGKTSTIHAFAYELFGPKLLRSRMLELNASHERNIDVIRKKVKAFANVLVVDEPYDTFPCPSYKLIVLDEADAMTVEAQRALRRVIENTSEQTRFCFICNYETNIIDPIISRCATFRFVPIPANVMYKRVQHVCKREKMHHANAAFIKTLLRYTFGDMRAVMNALQLLQPLLLHDHDDNRPKDSRALALLQDILGVVPRQVIDQFAKVLLTQNVTTPQLCITVDTMLLQPGYRMDQVLRQLLHVLMALPKNMSADMFVRMSTLLADAEMALRQPNVSERIVMVTLAAELTCLFQNTS